MTRESLYSEIGAHLLQDDAPSGYLNAVCGEPLFGEYPFELLRRLKDTGQSPAHHPEGSVWNHTMLVVDEAAKIKSRSRNGKVFMWAALLHDIGKPAATKVRKGRITSYDHDKLGAALTETFLREFTADGAFIGEVTALVRFHMQVMFVLKHLPFAESRE